jgi:tol-pal system protein YbgF
MGIRARISTSFERLNVFGHEACLVLSSGVLMSVASAGSVIAAVPVEDSLLRAAAELDAKAYGVSSDGVNNDRMNDDADLWTRAGQERVAGGATVGSDQPLFYQIQMLQQELRDLRGTVEEQAYLIQKLQSSQRSQYVDLDRRMTALAPNRPAPGPTPVPMADVMTEGSESLEGTQSSAPSVSLPQSETNAPPTTEREAYAQAIELMRGKRFDESTQAFGALIVKYPNGQYTPNAFYWLGELNLATGQIEPARQNFVQVIRLYPDHQKVPDALYKLGVLYFQLGDEAESRRYLQQVQSEYPQSSAGTLAKRYLAEME